MKKITMKNFVIGCAAISLFLTACGDDVTNDSVVKAEAYESKADLPDCGEKYEGMFATVPSKKEVYLCSEGSWKSLLNSATAAAVKDGEFACSTVELKDKSGYKVVCGGDSVAVVKNGANGSNGSQGPAGPSGAPGEAGSDGTGSNGKDLTLGKDDCAVMYTGLETVVYDCGDSVYVKNLSGDKANLKTWNALTLDTTLSESNGKKISNWVTQLLESPVANTSIGKLVRWDGDTWKSIQDVRKAEITRNLAVRGKATLEIKAGAKQYASVPVEPMIVLRSQFPDARDVSPWGGVCLTYDSKKDMEFIFTDNSFKKVARAKINASASKTTADILFSAFKADSADVELADILGNAQAIMVKIVGSLEEGTYENEFAIYEFGAYGRCSGYTINEAETNAKSIKYATGSVTDKRDNKKYKTVTIGDQTWFAENLNYDYRVHVDPADDVNDPDFTCTSSYPCKSDMVYKFTSEASIAKYGERLYSWTAAIDSAALARGTTPLVCGYGKTCTMPEQVQGICPEGWHLPSTSEWTTLLNKIKEDLENSYGGVLWTALVDPTFYGKNWSGFSALFSGYVSSGVSDGGSGTRQGEAFEAWAKEESGNNYSSVMIIYSYDAPRVVPNSTFGKSTRRSVRCIQDKVKE